MLSSMENMFCNIVQAKLWRGKVLGKNWLNITFLRIKVLEQIVLQELRPSPAIHIILIDMTGFYRGEGRGFLWFYTKIIFVLSSETALDVRPFCVKICQLGLIFQFSILLELEGSLSLDWVSGRVNFPPLVMTQWELRHRGNFSFMKIELTQVDHNIAIYMWTSDNWTKSVTMPSLRCVPQTDTKPRSVGSFFTCCLHPSPNVFILPSLSPQLFSTFLWFIFFCRNAQAGSQE